VLAQTVMQQPCHSCNDRQVGSSNLISGALRGQNRFPGRQSTPAAAILAVPVEAQLARVCWPCLNRRMQRPLSMLSVLCALAAPVPALAHQDPLSRSTGGRTLSCCSKPRASWHSQFHHRRYRWQQPIGRLALPLTSPCRQERAPGQDPCCGALSGTGALGLVRCGQGADCRRLSRHDAARSARARQLWPATLPHAGRPRRPAGGHSHRRGASDWPHPDTVGGRRPAIARRHAAPAPCWCGRTKRSSWYHVVRAFKSPLKAGPSTRAATVKSFRYV